MRLKARVKEGRWEDRAYQLENQLDIGDYDVRALLIRPQKSEEARSTRESLTVTQKASVIDPHVSVGLVVPAKPDTAYGNAPNC
ncbi:hypothetical protein M0804_007734 [Polistes exclamans]|nr:hypothetical protein M0804_007734 [Polistes exclamans]